MTMVHLIPRRRTWKRSLDSDWSSALIGMLCGLLASGMATAFALMLEIMRYSLSSPVQRPEADDLAFLLVGVPTGIASLGTAIALLPMTIVAFLERAVRVDLGPICWTLFGLLPSLLAGSMMPGTVSGGIAMAAGGVGGLVAWTKRDTAQDDASMSWELVLVLSLVMTVLTVPLCLQMPPLPASD